jgi:hypothetical protein
MQMGNLVPDDGPPRLIRFSDEPLGADDIAARLNKEQNLLVVRKDYYERLSPMAQDMLVKTDKEYVFLDELAGLGFFRDSEADS